jgi:hypothetical protein
VFDHAFAVDRRDLDLRSGWNHDAARLSNALRPTILYGIDTRTDADIPAVRDMLGEQRILERGGSALSSQAAGLKLAWLRKHEPDVWDKTSTWFSSSSFLVARLTGEYLLDHHTASQFDPLYDITTGEWATDWIAQLCPGVEFPRLVWSDQVVGVLHQNAAAATGLPIGTPVLGGTVDAWAEALASGEQKVFPMVGRRCPRAWRRPACLPVGSQRSLGRASRSWRTRQPRYLPAPAGSCYSLLRGRAQPAVRI